MEDPRNLNFYERLGVEEDADQDTIERARKEMVKQLHPDQRSGPYAKHFDEMLKGVNEAFDQLRDPERRARYDNRLHYERESAKGREEDAERAHAERVKWEAARAQERHAEEKRERQRRESAEEEYRRTRAEEEAGGGFSWSEDDGQDAPKPGYPPSPAAGGDFVQRAGAMAENIPVPLDLAGAAVFGAVVWMVFVVVVGSLPALGLSAVCALVAVGLWRSQYAGAGLLVTAALAVAPITSLLSTPFIGIVGPLALLWAALKLAAVAGQYRRV